MASGTAGGCEHHVLQLLSGLDRRQFEPWLAVFEAQPDDARPLLDDFRSLGVQTVALAERGRIAPRAMLRYGRLLGFGRFDLIHTHALRADLATLAWLTGRRQRPRLVRTVHNTDTLFVHPVLGRIARRSARRMDAVVAISDAVARFLEQTIDLAPERVTRIRYGLEPSLEGVERPAHLAAGPVLLVPARLDPQKGQDVLVQALPRILRARPDVQVWLAGHETGATTRGIARLADQLGVADHVRVLGFRRDVRELMRAADVVVLPSRWEGFGLVLLEAMDAARVVVASAVGAIPEVVAHGETGVLVPPDDPDALAEAIVGLLASPDRARAMGAAGRRRLIEHFSERAMLEATQALYNGLLCRPGAITSALGRRFGAAGDGTAAALAKGHPRLGGGEG
jgi:glycosyltransferase involved in cell wall biosynthesis